jgi:rhodanese-related sulfurtransferase
MADDIGAERLRELLGVGAQLLEVLPQAEYLELHLPGAINVPLKQLGADTVSGLDRNRPTIVYCWDSI